jgi:poly(3-hydroxybutyrate) depolymerase
MGPSPRAVLAPLLAASILLSAPAARADDAKADAALERFLAAKTPEEKAAAARDVVAEKPAFERVAARLAKGRAYAADAPRGWLRRTQRASDGKERDVLLLVPESYDPAKKHRLVVDLHGGVGRPAPLSHDALEQMKFFWGAHAEANGYLLALPTGETKAEWWTEVGASTVLGVIAAAKREWNVDEDLVFAAGFSDGASGCHYLALAHPTPFAGFVALNGHVGVAQAGGLEVHLGNFRNVPVYAVNTDLDGLYPSAAVKPVADALAGLGTRYRWREVKGFGHDPSYLEEERGTIWAWLQGVRRDPRPAKVFWQGAPGAPSRVHALGKATVADVGGIERFPSPNPMLPPGRVRLGVNVDTAFAGPGVRVSEVTDGSVAKAAGLLAGDVLLAIDDAETGDARALRGALSRKSAGDTVRIRLRRGSEEAVKTAAFPKQEPEAAFRRGPLHGAIEVERKGNAFSVACGNVSSFELLLEVGSIDFAAPVVVSVNGTEAFRGLVEPEVAFLLERAAEDDDRAMLYGARLTVKVPARTAR